MHGHLNVKFLIHSRCEIRNVIILVCRSAVVRRSEFIARQIVSFVSLRHGSTTHIYTATSNEGGSLTKKKEKKTT